MFSRIVEQDDENAVLQVHAAAMRDAVQAALAKLPLIDLKIEDAPLEEVMADLFAKSIEKRPP